MESVWMVRAGEGGHLIKEFAKGFVAIGWKALGDMTNVTDLESIRKRYVKAYPEAADSICKCTTAGFVKDFLGCPVAKTFSWAAVEPLNRPGKFAL